MGKSLSIYMYTEHHYQSQHLPSRSIDAVI